MTEQRKERCETCRFCSMNEDAEGAVCRRHAPSPVYIRTVHQPGMPKHIPAFDVAWPNVDIGFFDDDGDYNDIDDWCGEYQPTNPDR